jgi:hypothetical protein
MDKEARMQVSGRTRGLGSLLASPFLAGTLLLGACAGAYIASPSGDALDGARHFTLRYNDLTDSQEAVTRLIAGQCGAGFSAARLDDQPLQGTVLHPHQVAVECLRTAPSGAEDTSILRWDPALVETKPSP